MLFGLLSKRFPMETAFALFHRENCPSGKEKLCSSALLLSQPLPKVLSCGVIHALVVEETDPAPIALVAVNCAKAIAVKNIHGLLRYLLPRGLSDGALSRCNRRTVAAVYWPGSAGSQSFA